MPTASLTTEIDASAAEVMAVITDFAAYPDFLPEMKKVEIVTAAPRQWEVRFHLGLIRPLVYTLRLELISELELRWSLVEGAFRSNDGGWKLTADTPDKTTAAYTIDVQVSMFVPGNILALLTQKSLPDTLARFRAEAERRRAEA